MSFLIQQGAIWMSGGPILNEDGDLIAITGLTDQDPRTDEYYDLIAGVPVNRFSDLIFALGYVDSPNTGPFSSENTDVLRLGALMGVAENEIDRGNREVAFQHLNAVLSEDPSYFKAYFARSGLLNAADATNDLTKAIDLAEKSVNNNNEL